MKDQKLVLLEYIFDVHSKMHVLAVLRLTVALQMISNSHRSSPLITDHLPIDLAGGRYCPNRRDFEIITVV